MSWMLALNRSPRSARGFTLVEVLIAAFILALGLLGLLAMFAGAARQQQVATLTSVADAHARSAEAVLGPVFGQLQNFDGTFVDGVWHQLSMDEQQFFLSVNPGDVFRGPYFLVPSRWSGGYVVYQAPDPGMSAIPLNDPGNPGGLLMQQVRANDFGERRVEPWTMFITVEVSRSPLLGIPPETFTYQRLAVYDDPNSPVRYADRVESFAPIRFPLNGLPTNQNDDYVTVDTQIFRNGTDPARIAAMLIKAVRDDSTTYISRITVSGSFEGNQQWAVRADQLVSLRDRVLYRPDSSAPNGERAFLAYSLLYRVNGSQSQMAVFTYDMTPGSGRAQWIPPERRADFNANPQRSPIRGVRMQLAFDSERKQYYLTSTLPEDQYRWAMGIGQVIMIRGFSATERGADAPVRIVSQERVGNRIRGYLDRGPRARGASLVPARQRETGQSVQVIAYAVNDVVRSVADESEWRLRPLGATVFTVSGGG